MLKGGTSPSLAFQKFCRWYSAHSGVFRNFLFSFLVSILVVRSLKTCRGPDGSNRKEAQFENNWICRVTTGMRIT